MNRFFNSHDRGWGGRGTEEEIRVERVNNREVSRRFLVSPEIPLHSFPVCNSHLRPRPRPRPFLLVHIPPSPCQAWRAVSHVKSRGRTKRRARTESFCSLSSSYSATDIPAQPARKSGGGGNGDSPATVRNKKRRLLEQRRRIPPEQEKRGKPSTTESSVSLSSSSTGAGALPPPSGLSCDSKERGSTTAATASPSMSRARNRTTPPSPLETAGRADASVGHERKRPASKHDAAAALPGSSSKRSKRSGRAESGVLPRGPPLRGFSKGVLALDKAPGTDGGGSDSSAGHDERNPARRAGSGAGGSGSSTVPISSGGGRSVNKMSRNVHGGLHSDRGRNRADDGKRHSCREFDCARRAHFGTPGWVPVHCVEHRRDWEVFLKASFLSVYFVCLECRQFRAV